MAHKIETIYCYAGMLPWAERLLERGYWEDEWTDASNRVFYKTVERNNKRFERRIEFVLRGWIIFDTKEILQRKKY